MHKRLWLILGYMAFIFCVIVFLFHYAKNSPLEDVRVEPKPEDVQVQQTGG